MPTIHARLVSYNSISQDGCNNFIQVSGNVLLTLRESCKMLCGSTNSLKFNATTIVTYPWKTWPHQNFPPLILRHLMPHHPPPLFYGCLVLHHRVFGNAPFASTRRLSILQPPKEPIWFYSFSGIAPMWDKRATALCWFTCAKHVLQTYNLAS